MIENIDWSQIQLAEHWQVAESTLERWCSEGIGPDPISYRENWPENSNLDRDCFVG